MTRKQTSLAGFLVMLSALVGYQVGLSDLANFAHDEFTIIRKNLDKSCYYYVHEQTLLALCPK
ncbi:hypothetical protein B6T80_23175 [Salmonella enterica subsp. enterica serovar Newport]|nr:hypothetical protein [Salmonella enterica subsp. enterica serovar Newport]